MDGWMSVLAAPPGEIERKDIRHWPRPTDAEAQCCSLAMIIVRTPPCVESRQYEVHIIEHEERSAARIENNQRTFESKMTNEALKPQARRVCLCIHQRQ